MQHGEAPAIVVTARDAQGQALTGLSPEIRLAHPTDKRRDVALEFVELSPGRFRSLTPMPEGQWDLVIGLKREAETVFRSKAVGEPPLMLALSVWLAIRDAISSLSGYRLAARLDAPATPERVLAAVDDIRARDQA